MPGLLCLQTDVTITRCNTGKWHCHHVACGLSCKPHNHFPKACSIKHGHPMLAVCSLQWSLCLLLSAWHLLRACVAQRLQAWEEVGAQHRTRIGPAQRTVDSRVTGAKRVSIAMARKSQLPNNHLAIMCGPHHKSDLHQGHCQHSLQPARSTAAPRR